MDAAGVEKTVIFTGAGAPDRFAEIAKPYSKYPGRFEPWCVFDMTGANEPGFGPNAVKALEACHAAGAVGVGELSDKGWGFRVPAGRERQPAPGEARRAAEAPLRRPVPTPTTLAWTPYGTAVRSWECRSTFTCPIPSGHTSRWTAPTTA